MKLSQQSQLLIESTIKQAITKYNSNNELPIVTDILIQPNPTSGEIIICNDDDEELASAIIEDFLMYKGDNFYDDCERILRTVLVKMKEDGNFDQMEIVQPYSFVLIDEEKESISDLLFIDDDVIQVNDELLKGLDDELNNFLKDLLTY